MFEKNFSDTSPAPSGSITTISILKELNLKPSVLLSFPTALKHNTLQTRKPQMETTYPAISKHKPGEWCGKEDARRWTSVLTFRETKCDEPLQMLANIVRTHD